MLGVVLGHSLSGAKQAAGVTGGLDFTRAGLDIFFIISGLLVWRLTRSRETHPALFFLHRVSRLAPLYWLSTLAYVAVVPWLGRGFLYQETSFQVSDIVRSIFFVPYFNSHHDILPTLEPGWTLPYDVWYFFLFSIVLCVPRRQQLIIATVIYGALPVVHLLGRDEAVVQVATHPRALDFLAGIWIAHALETGRLIPRLPAQILASACIALMIAFIMFGLPARGLTFGAWAAAGCLATYAMASIEGRGGPWLALPQLLIVGASSYPVYLLQPVTITASFMLVPGGVWPKFAAGLLTSLALGIAAHIAVERPLNAGLKKLERKGGFRPQADVTVAP